MKIHCLTLALGAACSSPPTTDPTFASRPEGSDTTAPAEASPTATSNDITPETGEKPRMEPQARVGGDKVQVMMTGDLLLLAKGTDKAGTKSGCVVRFVVGPSGYSSVTEALDDCADAYGQQVANRAKTWELKLKDGGVFSEATEVLWHIPYTLVATDDEVNQELDVLIRIPGDQVSVNNDGEVLLSAKPGDVEGSKHSCVLRFVVNPDGTPSTAEALDCDDKYGPELAKHALKWKLSRTSGELFPDPAEVLWQAHYTIE
jgi:hypothetical protein